MTRTQLSSGQIKGVNLASGSDDVTGTLPVGNGGTGQTSLTNLPLTTPKIDQITDVNGNTILKLTADPSPANYLEILNTPTGTAVVIQPNGTDTNRGLWIVGKGSEPVYVNGAEAVNISTAQNISGKTYTGISTTDGIAAINLPNGITNGNTSAQSQLVVSGTSYYVAGSNLNLPATLKAGMAVGTRFRWRVAMAKTSAGTGAFAIEIRRGTAGTTADTADVSQSIGTQTAVVDSMVFDVEMVVTTTGATGAYYWTIIPVHAAATATGFGVATGATGQFSGTVSSVAMNTASLKFGLSFKATTGTPTITIPMVQSSAINIS